MIGTCNAGPVLTSFDFVFLGAGCFMEVFPEQVIIEVPPVGVPFCDPGMVNSTGNAAVLSGTAGSGIGADLHLECSGGVPGELGYFLVGDTANDPGSLISDGEFCLIGGMSQFFRYNVSGTPGNSVGLLTPLAYCKTRWAHPRLVLDLMFPARFPERQPRSRPETPGTSRSGTATRRPGRVTRTSPMV